MRLFITLIMFLAFCTGVQAEVKTKTIKYRHGNAMLEGFMAYDDTVQGKRPGVLIVHEWWGLNDYARKRAEEVAGLGYVAFAVDMYGEGINTTDPKKAAELSATYRNDRKLMFDRAMAGLDVLTANPLVEPAKVAAIGYCFGGTTVLELARGHAPVLGVVSFHGGLDTPNPMATKDIKSKVLVLHGADDPFASKELINTFMDEMRRSGADWQMNFYGGALHSFTNPDADKFGIKGIAYNEKADKRSWQAMKSFFAEIFK